MFTLIQEFDLLSCSKGLKFITSKWDKLFVDENNKSFKDAYQSILLW